MKNIITIAGFPGSGKSSVARMVAADLGYDHFSSGELFRMLAEEEGLDLLSASVSAEQDADIDLAVDRKLRQIGEHQDKLVIDSRMAWYWIPESFKVFLTLDFETAAKRIIETKEARKNANENIPTNVAEYAGILEARFESERRRYQALYKVDLSDKSNYDLIIDTKANDQEAVSKAILTAYQKAHSRDS